MRESRNAFSNLLRKVPNLQVSAVVIASALTWTLQAHAQNQPGVGGVDASVQKPIPGAGHDYIHLFSETVNPATGQLSVRIELPAPKGRGITPPVIFAYNSGELSSLTVPTGSLLWATSSQNPVQATGWGIPASLPLTGNATQWNMTSPEPPQGWSEIQNCNYASGFSFTGPDGTAHTLGLGASTLATNNSNGGECNTSIPPSTGNDGEVQGALPSNTGTLLANGNPIPISVIDKYGNTYAVGTPGMGSNNPGSASMEDRNGNEVSPGGWTEVSGVWQPTGSDTAARALALQVPAVAGTYNVYGLDYVVATKSTTVDYDPQDLLYIENDAANCNVTAEYPKNQATVTVISSITLPDGEEYQFNYDPTYGAINEIIFPDGGTVSYTWSLSSNNGSPVYTNEASYPAVHTVTGMAMNNACTITYQTPVVTTRTVSFDGSTTAQSQSFTYAKNWNQTTLTAQSASVTTLDGKTGNSFLTAYTYATNTSYYGVPFSTANFPIIPLEATVKHYDWGNTTTPLDTVNEAWANQFEKACEVHTLNNGKSYGHFYTWTNGFISDDKAFDMGQVSNLGTYCTPTGATPPSTTPARETVTTFQQFTSPVPPNLTFAKPATVISYGSGSELAETIYTYDQFALQGVSGLTSHDETNLKTSVTTGRGNVTTVTVKCLSNGCTGDSVTKYYYDETGQVIGATDPCGNGSCTDMSAGSAPTCFSYSSFTPTSHTTCYSWADEYSSGGPTGDQQSNTYLTGISYPKTKTAHTNSFKYSYEMGELTSSTDENGQVTTYQYDDSMDRLTETQGPPDPNNGNESSSTTISYDDSAPNPSVTTSELLNTSNTWKTSKSIRDGMGHTVQTQQTDPSGTDYVDTLYDGEGRANEQSNPTRCSSSPGQMPSGCGESSWGITKSYYDALGRNVATSHPDGTYSTNCYNGVASTAPSGISITCNGQIGTTTGSWVDSKDEDGNAWQRSSDSFGDLIEAVEPNGTSKTPSMQTAYQYDGLSHLLSVIQQGDGSGNRNRYFAYDSQGHLVAAMNPETFASINSSTIGAALSCTGASDGLYSGSWTTCYTYDLNGNLVTKKNNRAITSTSSYDNLNRVTQTSYSDGVTPTVGFGYDGYDQSGNAISGLQYPIGRLTKSTNESVNAASEYSYDVMGRVLNRYNCLPGDCSYDINVQARYDLASDITSLTNGSTQQPVTFTYGYDSVARLTSLTSNWTPDCNHPGNLFSAPAYGPVGLTAATMSEVNSGCPMASTNLITETRSYDNRTRITSESFGASAIEVNAPTGSISISTPTNGEQSKLVGQAAGTGSITVSGSEQSVIINPCEPHSSCPTTVYDTGSVTATINGTQYVTGYGQGYTSQTIATNLAQVINNGSLVTATVVGGTTIDLAARTTGSGTDYSLSVTSATSNPEYFSSPSFTLGDSGSTLTGGANGTTSYDTGTITATVNGKQATASWSQGSTTLTLASALASALQTAVGSFLSASSSGGVVTVTSLNSQYWALSVTVDDTNSNFTTASFAATATGMASNDTSGTVYNYTVGYDGVNNTTGLTDSVMGTWTYQYDTLNRLLTTGEVSGGPYNGKYGCWSYDGFGDRTMEAISTTACNNSPTPIFQAQYNSSNQIKKTGLMPMGYDYDAAGDVTNDGANAYLYDGAGRICAANAAGILTGYIYDGEGNRIAKGSLSSWPTACPAQSQIIVNTQFVLGLGGEQLTEITGSGTTWAHTNVFAGGALLATYTNQTSGYDTVFALTDWQGTKRAENGVSGCLTGWSSMPYGNSGTNPGATTLPIDGGVGCAVDATEHHYTSTIHDSETGNDDFGARYFANTAGRWLSPDWAAAPEAVPYASYGSPQTLNLYAFVGNNPLSAVDPDGHVPRVWNGISPGGTDFGMTGAIDGIFAAVGFASPSDGPWSTRIAWSNLSHDQQSLVSGGEKRWNAMSTDAQDNYDAITHALEQIKLPGGANGLSEVQSAQMETTGREMNVTWKAGAANAFMSTGMFWDTHLNVSHKGAYILHQRGLGIKGMEMVFPTLFNSESQVHIDYRDLGKGHYKTYNDDVAYDAENEEEYRQWYGPLPGLIH